jgi:YD repeat-containing protein
VIYPNGRDVSYGYGSAGSIDDVLSRVATIAVSTADDPPVQQEVAAYTYLGVGTIASEDYVEPDVKLDYAADHFAAWDRFGRVLDQVWAQYGEEPATLDEYTYTYDRAGNRRTRGNALHTDFSESYLYDAMNRLTSSTRADDHVQGWTLDGLGNWTEFTGQRRSPVRGEACEEGVDRAGRRRASDAGCQQQVHEAVVRGVDVRQAGYVPQFMLHDRQ